MHMKECGLAVEGEKVESIQEEADGGGRTRGIRDGFAIQGDPDDLTWIVPPVWPDRYDRLVGDEDIRRRRGQASEEVREP